MLNLVGSTDKIRVVLAGAVTTNQLHGYASYSTNNQIGKVYGRNWEDTNDTTPVDLVDPPLNGTDQITIDYLSVYNNDTANAIVTINFYDGTNDHELFKATLAVGEKVEYVEGQGFRVFTNSGSIKTSLNQGNAPASSTLSVVILGSDVTNDNAVADTLEDITGLSFPVNSGSVYYFKFHIHVEETTPTNGYRFTINGPSKTSIVYSTTSVSTINTYDDYELPIASVGAGGGVDFIIIEGTIKPSANGTVIARFASELNTETVTAKEGSFVQYQQMT